MKAMRMTMAGMLLALACTAGAETPQERLEDYSSMVARASQEPDRDEALSLITEWFRTSIEYTSDKEQFGVKEYYQSMNETLKNGKGDCEDYAIGVVTTAYLIGLKHVNLALSYTMYRGKAVGHAVAVDTLYGVGPEMPTYDSRPGITPGTPWGDLPRGAELHLTDIVMEGHVKTYLGRVPPHAARFARDYPELSQ